MLIEKDFNLIQYNSYKIKATCSIAYFPEKEEDLVEIYKQHNEEIIVLGGGYNTIFSKTHYNTPFIIFDAPFSDVLIDKNIFKAEAGISMLQLSELAYKNSLSGLEIFYDIPSSLGGAIVMNAGAGGEEIKDLLIKVRYFNPETLSFNEILKQDINFEYRNSLFQRNPNLIVTAAWLNLNYGNGELIWDKMNTIKSNRWAKQPRDLPNAGSVFKRPPGRFVGPMIDELGLKGFSIGGAQISPKHSGFIVNTGNATGQDIIELIHFVKEKVLTGFKVNLEIEQRII